MTKLKAFADDKLSAKMTISLCDREENTGEKGQSASYYLFR